MEYRCKSKKELMKCFSKATLKEYLRGIKTAMKMELPNETTMVRMLGDDEGTQRA